MPDRLAPVSLTPDTVAQALPLVRSLIPALELEAWAAFAHAHIEGAPARGIVGVRDGHGYFHAIFAYHVRSEILHGQVLDVTWATTIDLLDPAGAVGVLIREFEALAGRLGCTRVQVRLQPMQRRLRRRLEAEGFVLPSVVLEKPLNA